MSHPVITVEKLSKSYLLTHKKEGKYLALRDVITEKALSIFRKNKIEETREEFLALNDVSFEVAQGDRIGIIGRNGAGKSTLLKILSRIVSPSKGQVIIEGRVASLLEVGTGFHPELTGRENIFLNGSILGMRRTEIQNKFDEIVAFAEVEKFLDTPVKRYSSGMYVRLAFAVAAHLEPEILIVDEVLAVGDAQFQKKCLGKMDEVSRNEGRTVLFVSHALSMVSKLCNKGILLHEGKVVKDADITTVISSYEENIIRSQSTNILSPGVMFEANSNDPEQHSILSVKFLDGQLKPKESINTFDELIVEIEFYSPSELENGSVSFFFKTLNDVVVFRFATQPDQLINVRFKKGKNKVRCTIPKLQLPQGNYQFSAGLAIPMRQWLYNNTDLFIMKVNEKDVFNSGYPPLIENSVAVTNYAWEIL
jgi:lipopolysaccharide transport system ATP-binding protein